MKTFMLSALLRVADFADLHWVRDAHLLFADAMAFGENMNRLLFTAACGLAVTALVFTFLPSKLRVLRWLNFGPVVGSVLLVINIGLNNTPQWLPAPILGAPVGVSLVAAWRSWRVLAGRPEP